MVIASLTALKRGFNLKTTCLATGPAHSQASVRRGGAIRATHLQNCQADHAGNGFISLAANAEVLMTH